jgi:Ca-activated chloride channel family protein
MIRNVSNLCIAAPLVMALPAFGLFERGRALAAFACEAVGAGGYRCDLWSAGTDVVHDRQQVVRPLPGRAATQIPEELPMLRLPSPMRRRLVLALACFIASFLTFAYGVRHAHAEQVRLRAGMAQRTMAVGSPGTAYLHINLDGIALASKKDRAPVNVALVIDRSGSMGGDKIDHAKRAAVMALGMLDARDIVSVVAFDDQIDVLVSATPMRERGKIEAGINALFARGSTALYAGVEKGGDQLETYLNRERVNRVILLSDGLANVGPSSPDEVAQLGYKLVKKGISVTTLGLGMGYNEDLMTRLANVTDGNHAFIENPDELEKFFALEFGDLTSVVAQDVTIHVHIYPNCGCTPKRSLWREAEIRGNDVTARINQVYGGQQKDLTIELSVPTDKPVGAYDIADVTVTYKDMASNQVVTSKDSVRLTLTRDAKEAEASIDKEVMSRVVSLQAVERNEAAMKLRDAGKLDEAKKAYQDNAAFLKDNAAALAAPALAAQAQQADDYAGNLGQEKWNETRKKQMHQQRSTGAKSSY